MPTDFIGLFAMLAAAKVRFVLVGGLALVLHGLDRLTADVDLVIDLSVDSARAAAEASVMAIGGHEIRVASIEHLIRMKVAAGRPQDLADIERLRAKQKG
jgi:predicted nucleotidyltransferase